ncbi:uncharacterized protein LOC134259012 isoform X2 [Saccostrea cucullata]|uniref:uncharacterized protein LOC134259012 isoform X2 n=1 Tax=Saccostrea cuccullata TaxID=36930 RepID=UPI002ED698A8
MGLNQAAATSVGLPVNQATEDELNPIEIDSSLLAGSLDLLTAAAQVQELQDSLKSTVETLHQQRILNHHLQLQLSATSQHCTDPEPEFTVEKILQQEKKNPGLFLYYTNLKYCTFVTLLEFLTSQQLPEYAKKRKEIKRMNAASQLLLTLMRLRHNFGLKDLAARFCISKQSVSEVFNAWVDHMYMMLGAVPIWPHRDHVISNMPLQFRSEFPRTIAIVDCTELKTQKPSSLKLQSQMYSDYKSGTTLKGLVACDPMGNIVFVSELFTGSMSDVVITQKSGFYKLLRQLLEAGYILQGDCIMADKGFTIESDLKSLGLHLNLPSFVSSGTQMPQSDVDLTQKIAAHRIHVERAIRKIRTFKIVSHCIPTSIFGSINKVWTVCALLTLWQDPVLKKK